MPPAELPLQLPIALAIAVEKVIVFLKSDRSSSWFSPKPDSDSTFETCSIDLRKTPQSSPWSPHRFRAAPQQNPFYNNIINILWYKSMRVIFWKVMVFAYRMSRKNTLLYLVFSRITFVWFAASPNQTYARLIWKTRRIYRICSNDHRLFDFSYANNGFTFNICTRYSL